jgi:hypothetical protein
VWIEGSDQTESFRSVWLQVFYGHPQGAPFDLTPLPPLDVDLRVRPYDRFRVTFDASDVGLNFNMQMVTANNPAPHQLGINVEGQTGQFCVDFPFRNFKVNAGPPPDLEHVNQIRLLLSSASAVGSNDYAISGVETASGPASCLIAWNP